MRLATKSLLVLAATALLALPVANADEVQDAIAKLLKDDAGSLVIVEFDLQRIDGRGGQDVKLQGTVVGKDGLVLVSSAKRVDPPVGGAFQKPEEIMVRFPGDVKKKARFVGKDEELNLALVKLVEEESSDAVEEEKTDEPADEKPAEGEAKEETGDDEEDEEPVIRPATFAFEGEFVPGQPLLTLRRLGHQDDDLVTFSTLRVTAVIPRPGLPMQYRLLGGLRGSEGCPVFTTKGELVGFVAASTQTGGRGRFRFVNGRLVRDDTEESGHPIRILHAKYIREFLADPTRFSRRDSWLGVKNLQALTKPLAEAYGIEKPGGIVIGDVGVESPAEAAGLKPADVIVAKDGEKMETLKDRDIAAFKREIRLGKAGAEMLFKVLRRGEEGLQEVEVKATLQESPLSENEVPEYHDKKFGLKLKPLTRDFLERSRLKVDIKGVRVVSVDSASWASIAGIQSGDVIRKMVLKPCQNLDQYKKIMADLLKTRDAEVCYNVMRSRKSLFLCVRPDWSSVEKEK